MRRSWLGLAAVMSAGLAACTQPEPPSAPAARTIPPGAQAAPVSESGAAGNAAAAETAVPPPAPRPEGLVRAAPAGREDGGGPQPPASEMVGMSERELADVMGPPDGVRAEPPASVWRYNLKGCVIELFLFEDVASGRTKALSYDIIVLGEEGAPMDPRCLEGKKVADE